VILYWSKTKIKTDIISSSQLKRELKIALVLSDLYPQHFQGWPRGQVFSMCQAVPQHSPVVSQVATDRADVQEQPGPCARHYHSERERAIASVRWLIRSLMDVNSWDPDFLVPHKFVPADAEYPSLVHHMEGLEFHDISFKLTFY